MASTRRGILDHNNERLYTQTRINIKAYNPQKRLYLVEIDTQKFRTIEKSKSEILDFYNRGHFGVSCDFIVGLMKNQPVYNFIIHSESIHHEDLNLILRELVTNPYIRIFYDESEEQYAVDTSIIEEILAKNTTIETFGFQSKSRLPYDWRLKCQYEGDFASQFCIVYVKDGSMFFMREVKD